MSSWPSRSAAPPAAPCSNTGSPGRGDGLGLAPGAARRRRASSVRRRRPASAAATSDRRCPGSLADCRARAGLHRGPSDARHREPARRPPDRAHAAPHDQRPGAGRAGRFRHGRPARVDAVGALGGIAGCARVAVLGHRRRRWSRDCSWPIAPVARCISIIVASGPASPPPFAACGWTSFISRSRIAPTRRVFAPAMNASWKARGTARPGRAAPAGRHAALPIEWSGMTEADRRRDFARYVLAQAWELHQQPHNHGVDPASGKRVSFGLVRMANIDPLFDVALAMYAQARPRPACACTCASTTRSFPCWRAPASSGRHRA